MSSKVMITYKRKRVTSRRDTTDETVHDASSTASNNVVARSLPPKYETNGENNVKGEDNFPTSTKQHGVGTSAQRNIKDKVANQSTEKGENKFQSCQPIVQKEQPEICCDAILSNTEAQNDKLQCTDGTKSPVPVSSSVCDPMHIDRMTSRTEDSNTSAHVEINYHQAPENPRSDQCKNKSSPLLTFHRRVKKRTSSAEPTEENCSPDNKQCSTLTCNPPKSSQDTMLLLKHTNVESSDIEPKEAVVGISGPPIQAEHSHDEQESLHNVKSSVQHMFPSLSAEAVNQLEHNVTPVSKFTGVLEVSEEDARVENLSITTPGTIEVPEVIDLKREGHANGQINSLQSLGQEINVSCLKSTNKSVADLLESQGSTKNVPVIVLDDDSDEKSKELENSEVRDQGVQNKNKSRFSLGKIDLNFTELRQEEPPLHLDDSSIQWFPDQGQFGNAQKQMSPPIERMFFTKEKDTMHGKQQQREGSSTTPTLYSTWFDQTPPRWNTGNFKAPSMPSELKFRIMDKVPEFSLDLSLDSLPNCSVSYPRSNKLFLGGNPSVSHKTTEKLGTYSYKRRSAPWSEEELDFLWIGVRRYGVNNWNAMLRDTRLHFSNSRMPDDLAKQWDKEQTKLLGADLLQSVRTSSLVPALPSHISEAYLGRGSCSGCSKSLFLAAQTDLSLGDVYLQNAHGPGRGEHQLSSLEMLNLHGIDSGPRNLSLGGYPGASSSYGRSGRRRRGSKFHKSNYHKASWFQQPSGRLPQLFPTTSQQPMNSGLPQWLTKDAETGTSRVNLEMWPSMAPPPGHSAGDPLNDVLPDASLKRTMRRNADWRSFSKRLFQTGDALDLNQGAAAAIAGPNGATASDARVSSEETVSDS